MQVLAFEGIVHRITLVVTLKIMDHAFYLTLVIIAVFSMASMIIAGNAAYQSHLVQFLAPTVGNDPKWLLCYRASTDGWDVNVFHNNCNGKNHTVTIIKVGDYVFGGYTDIPWGKYNYSVFY